MNEVIEFKCLKCSYPLKEKAIHIGKKAKCPSCKAITKIPAASNLSSPEKSGGTNYDAPKKIGSKAIPKEGWIDAWKIIGSVNILAAAASFFFLEFDIAIVLGSGIFGSGVICFWLSWLTEMLVQMRYVSTQQLEYLKRMNQ